MPFDGDASAYAIPIASTARSSIWKVLLDPCPDLTELPLPLQILIMAESMIAKKSSWTQGSYQVGEGHYARYCAVGAIKEATSRLGGDSSHKLQATLMLEHSINGRFSHSPAAMASIEHFNDHNLHSDVVKAFRDTIQRENSQSTNLF